MKSRILVCGGRDFKDHEFVKKTLDHCKQWFTSDFCLIHGSARGADMSAHEWAFFEGCPVIEMKANWGFYDKGAGPIRNEWMIKYAKPDLVIAFPGGNGTKNMVEQARYHRIDVFVVPYP